VTDTLRPEYTAEQVAEVVEGLTAIITEPAECWHPTHISRDDIRTVLAEIQRLTLKVESAGEDSKLLAWAIDAGLIYNAGIVKTREELARDKADSDKMEFAARNQEGGNHD